MRGQTGIMHRFDRGMLLEKLGDALTVSIVRLHPYVQRLRAAQHEPRIPWARYCARSFLKETQLSGYLLAVGRDDAANHIRVPVQVLRARVHDGIDTQLQR